MRASDAALASLEAATDTIGVDANAADELFAVVDLLDGQPQLRRSLSDPSATPEERVGLATRLLGGRIGAPAMSVLTEVVKAAWRGPRQMVGALESLAVRALLRAARDSGTLPQVQSELHGFATTVDRNAELADALRDRTRPLAARRDLVRRLAHGKVDDITLRLLNRAAAARVRTLPLTVHGYLRQAAGLAGQEIARVTVSRPLDQGRTERLKRALEVRTGRPVVLQLTVDPRVLGGMNVQFGHHIIESTVAGRLDDARRLLQTT